MSIPIENQNHSITSEQVLKNQLARAQEKISILEKMIEEKTTEIYHEKEEFKELYSFLNGLIGTLTSGLIVTNREYQIELVNASGEQIFGSSQKEMLGKTLNTIIPSPELHQLLLFTPEYLPEGESIQFQYPHPVTRSLRFYTLSMSILRDSNQNATGLICLVLDVTKQKEVERQLLQSQKLESVGVLAAGISHEINTPMQFVRDNAEYARNEIPRLIEMVKEYVPVQVQTQAKTAFLMEELPSALDELLQGADSVIRIVRSMKDFSHPGSNHPETFDLHKCIDSTVTVSRNEWKYCAELKVESAEKLPLVKGFPGEINQVLLNIIVNAAHAIEEQNKKTKRSQGTIKIRSLVSSNWVEIRIKDNGGGIPEEIQNRVFDPFFTTKEVGRGTGQGLALAYSTIVDKHKGRLFFQSEEGVGTEFVIALPY